MPLPQLSKMLALKSTFFGTISLIYPSDYTGQVLKWLLTTPQTPLIRGVYLFPLIRGAYGHGLLAADSEVQPNPPYQGGLSLSSYRGGTFIQIRGKLKKKLYSLYQNYSFLKSMRLYNFYLNFLKNIQKQKKAMRLYNSSYLNFLL